MEMTKVCTKCNIPKPLAIFSKSKGGKHGVVSTCRPCKSAINLIWSRNNKDKCKEYRKKTREKHPEADKAYSLKNKYNISITQYNQMLEKQNGTCAICKKNTGTGKKLAVDHCHKTGKVRGLLCTPCNISLGGFKDDTNLLNSAIKYLGVSDA